MTEGKSASINILGVRLHRRTAVILLIGTTVLMLDYYVRVLPAEDYATLLRAKAVERIGYYLAVPLIVILLAFRRAPGDYGMKVGNWRRGLALAIGSAVAAAPVLYLAARSPGMREFYASVERPAGEVLWVSAVDLLGWEFFFRGFLLFGLAEIAGPNAILLQAVPFALAHLGKPALETFTTMLGGAYFGWVAWRTGSFVYAYLLHWLVNVFVILSALGYFGGG